MARYNSYDFITVPTISFASQYHLVNGRAVTFRNASHITSLLQFSAEEGLETGA